MKRLLQTLMAVLTLSGLSVLSACGEKNSPPPVEVKGAWVRSTVPGQKTTGAFMTITALKNTRLVGVSSSAATVTELHEMKMEGDVMKMRPVTNGLDLPAGQSIELKPGSYQVVLAGLKNTIPKDTTVTMTLRFKDIKGAESKTDLQVPVASTAPNTRSGFMSVTSDYTIVHKY